MNIRTPGSIPRPVALTLAAAILFFLTMGLPANSAAAPDPIGQTAQSDRVVEIQIAPQSLDSAILEFAEKTGIQVVFQSARIGTARSPGVSGSLTIDQALQSILSGTGVSYEFIDANSVRLVGPDRAGAHRLEAIQVFANKRTAEDVQSIAGTAHVFDQVELEESRSRGLEDLARQTPNTIVDERSNGDVIIFLRGNSTDNTSTDAGIGIYVDGAYNFIQGNNSNFPLFDIEEVNVLLGPQGALYGRNAVGGAINIKTADPTDQFEASGSAEYASYDKRRHRAVLNLPAGKKFSFRLAGIHDERESFYFNATNGTDEEDKLIRGGRAKALVKPVEGLDLVLTYERLVSSLPGSALTPVASIESFETVTDVIGFNNRNATRVNLTGDWEASDWLNVRSITSVHLPDGRSLVDGDSSATVNLAVDVRFDATQISQEFVFSSPRPLFGTLDWTAGATYFNDKIDTVQNNNFLAGAFAGSRVETSIDATIDAYAVFAEANYALTDKLKATGSLRFSSEEKDVLTTQAVFGALAGVLAPAATIDETDTYYRIKPVGSLAYEWHKDLMTYAKVATAYKSGGVNFTAAPTPEQATFGPEDVISYEVGVRSTWLDERLQINATAFHQDQNDLQLRVRDVGAGINFFTNVGDAQTQGIELSARATPISGLTFYANYGYLRPRFKDAQVQSGGANVDVSDNAIPDIPAHTYNFGGRYHHIVNDWLDGYIRADHYMTRGGKADAQNLFSLDHKTSTNFAIGVESDHFSAQFFVENLFDNAYFEFSPTAAGLGQRNTPRIWGVSVTARW